MNQFARDEEPRITVNAFDHTRRAWLETRSLEDKRLQLKPNWDNAVELAYLSLKAADVVSTPASTEASNAAWVLADDLAEVADSHKQKAANSRPGRGSRGWRPHSYIPEPFRTLEDLADDHAFALGRYEQYSKVVPMERVPEALVDPEVTGARLTEGFMDAIGELIGPDVYIEAMNPYENDEPLPEAV